MTNYGDTSAKMIISSGNAGSIPSGNIWYFWTPEVGGSYQAMMKIKQLAGGSSYSNRDGKRNWSIDLKDCYVVKNTGATITEEFNLIIAFLQTATKAGAAPCYLWLRNTVDNGTDSGYLHLGNNAACSSATHEIKGYVTSYNWKMMPGAMYKFDIKFQECLT